MGITQPLNYGWEREPNQSDALKIPALNSSNLQYVRLRSANRDYAYGTWYVSTSGRVNNHYYASIAYRFSPVCVIC